MDKEYFMKRLAFNQPSAHEQYSYELLPAEFKAIDKVPIICHLHGVFEQQVSTHLSGAGCIRCGVERGSGKNLLDTELYIQRSMAKFGDRFGYGKTVYAGKDKLLIVTCPVHGDQELYAYRHLLQKTGCQLCDRQHNQYRHCSKLLELASDLHGGKYDYGRIRYVNIRTPVEIVCSTHGSFWQLLDSHARKGANCPSCVRADERVSKDQFVEKARAVHGDRYDYSKVVMNTVAVSVTITCRTHGDFVQRAQSHLSGNGCKQCFRDESKLSTEEFVRNARAVHGDRYDYSRVNYRGNKCPVEIICPTHGSFHQKPNGHVSQKNGCKICLESKGEKAVQMYLESKGIRYVREYRIKPARYRYDFYLPDYNVFIEFHGLQHYKPVEIFGGELAFRRTQERDKDKRRLVKLAGARLITLTYLSLTHGSVEKELSKRLKSILSLRVEQQEAALTQVSQSQ